MAKTDNAKYVRRGAGLMLVHDPEWERDVKRANRGKRGAPFQYSDLMITTIAATRAATKLAYRQMQGLASRMLGKDGPCYSTICRRVNNLKVEMHDGIVRVSGGPEGMVMIADATGIKQSNRGEWIRKKWKVYRGYIKLHIMVDANTRCIIAYVITPETVADAPMLPELLGQVAGRMREDGDGNVMPPARIARPGTRASRIATGRPPVGAPDKVPDGPVLLADGAYGSRKNMKCCGDLGINPLIRMKINACSRPKEGGRVYSESVRRQLGGGVNENVGALTDKVRRENQTCWKAAVGYGQRWNVEIVISAFKRMFGEHIRARKWRNMQKEIEIAIAQYNKWVLEAMGMLP